MTAEIHARLEPLAEEWGALADRTDAPPWLHPGWIAAWLGAFGSGDPETIVVRRSGELAGVLPLVRSRGALRSPTNWHTPHFGWVAVDAEAGRELAAEVLARRPRSVALGFLADETGVPETFRSAAREAGYRRILERTLMSSPYVSTGGSVEEWEASLDRKTLKELARRRRKLEAEGGVELDVQDGSQRLGELLDEGFRLESSGWKAQEGTAILSQPETERFYREIAEWAAARGWLRLAFLRHAGKAIAFQYLLEHGGSLLYVKGGYDRELGRFAPGQMLVRELIVDAFARGLASYEFLGHAERWKLDWTESVRPRVLVHAFAPSAAGAAEWAAFAYGRPLAKRALARVRR